MEHVSSYHDRLSMGLNPPSIVNVVIEGPKDGKNLYDFTTKGHVIVSKTLKFEIPYDFGTIPRALDNNQRPLKAIVLSSESSTPKSIVRGRPIALIKANSGKHSENILVCTALHDEKFEKLEKADDMLKSYRNKIEKFVKKYKKLDFDKVSIDWGDEARAIKAIGHSGRLYNKFKFGN